MNYRVDIMAVLMKGFLKKIGAELAEDSIEANFDLMRKLVKQHKNEELLSFLDDIEARNLKATFFRPQ